MDYFGINTTSDLPKISEVLMEELVQATMVNGVQPEMIEETIPEITAEENIETIVETEEAEIILAVTPDGEIIENKQEKKDGEEETGS
jgi:segregation and condensation protein B